MSAPLVHRREWTPPGYYVPSEIAALCAHCGSAVIDHQGAERFCPKPPLEVIR